MQVDRLLLSIGWAARTLKPPGRVRLARMLSRYGPDCDIMYRDQWGFRRHACLRDEMEAQAFVGAYPLGAAVVSRVKRGAWIIDAGASIGTLTAQFCHLVGPTGSVWAIEPVPRNVDRLRQLKELNGLDNLTIFQGALGPRTEPASLRLPRGGGSAYASFTKSWDMVGAIEVQSWALDDLLDGHGNGRSPDLIKIDVEGFEPQVLTGAERALQEMHPTVMCEFNDPLLRDAGSSSGDLLRQFADLGYVPIKAPGDLDGAVTDIILAPQW